MTPELERDRTSRLLLVAICLLALARLASFAFYPLMDMTEARYADIARRMAQSGDWVTPWLDDMRPFWSKPALSFWATAIGLKLLGVNAMGARLPHYLMGIGVVALVWLQGRDQSRRLAWHAVALLAGSLLFLLSVGAVMTDMALVLGTTLIMAGFWWRLQGRGGIAAAVTLFGGLAIGLLAKGPLALVVAGPPILAWVLWQREWRGAWRQVPWIAGLLAVTIVTLPWYLLAEQRSPGFLQYFIVGEHISRFLVPGWNGDLYSNAHGMAKGTIWLYAAASTLPWIVVLPIAWLAGGRVRHTTMLAVSERRYLLLWALWPCVFFTLASNILLTYVLPSLPALALLCAGWTAATAAPRWMDRLLAVVLIALAVSVPVLLVAGDKSKQFERHSQLALVRAYESAARPGEPLLEVPAVSFSTDFYAQGRARSLRYAEDLGDFADGKPAYVIIANDRWELLTQSLRDQFTPVAATPSYKLVRWR